MYMRAYFNEKKLMKIFCTFIGQIASLDFYEIHLTSSQIQNLVNGLPSIYATTIYPYPLCLCQANHQLVAQSYVQPYCSQSGNGIDSYR